MKAFATVQHTFPAGKEEIEVEFSCELINNISVKQIFDSVYGYANNPDVEESFRILSIYVNGMKVETDRKWFWIDQIGEDKIEYEAKRKIYGDQWTNT